MRLPPLVRMLRDCRCFARHDVRGLTRAARIANLDLQASHPLITMATQVSKIAESSPISGV